MLHTRRTYVVSNSMKSEQSDRNPKSFVDVPVRIWFLAQTPYVVVAVVVGCRNILCENFGRNAVRLRGTRRESGTGGEERARREPRNAITVQ